MRPQSAGEQDDADRVKWTDGECAFLASRQPGRPVADHFIS